MLKKENLIYVGNFHLSFKLTEKMLHSLKQSLKKNEWIEVKGNKVGQ
jgi:hypothetical protein